MNYRDENLHKPKPVWRVKNHVLLHVDLSNVSTESVRPGDEGLGFTSSGKDSPLKSCIQALKPLSLPFQGAKVFAGNSEEGFLSISPLRNLGFISPIKKVVHGTGYFLRSCTKMTREYPITSGSGLGRGISGFCSDGKSLKDNDQLNDSGARRAVLTLVEVTL